MDINPISSNKASQILAPDVAAIASKAPSVEVPSQAAVAQPKTDKDKDSITINATLPDKALQLGQLIEGNNNIAIKTKETDQKLGVVAAVVDRMRETLGGIIKNYPPFPPESRERMELLMSYASIQKELIQLTVPPPPPPVYEKVKHQWQELFANDSPNLPKLPPVMDSGTPDSVIADTAKELGNIHDSLSAIRSAVKQSLSQN